AVGLQAGPLGEAPQDEERASPSQWAAPRIQEELGPVAAVEVGPATREGAAQGLRRLPSHGHDALLASFAETADEPPVQLHPTPLEPESLRDAQAGAVEELHERGVPQVARARPSGRLYEALGLGGRERPREFPDAPG